MKLNLKCEHKLLSGGLGRVESMIWTGSEIQDL